MRFRAVCLEDDVAKELRVLAVVHQTVEELGGGVVTNVI